MTKKVLISLDELWEIVLCADRGDMGPDEEYVRAWFDAQPDAALSKMEKTGDKE